MSFIDFESGTEKERLRQELREVREELLKRAEADAKRRDEKELQRKFRGDDQWMLPSVSKRLGETDESSSRKPEKKLKKSKKSKKSSKKPKKEKKSKKSKKKKYASSSNDENSDDEGSSDEEKIPKKAKKRKNFEESGSSSESGDDDSAGEWIEKPIEKETAPEKPLHTAEIQRDDWLGGFGGISTFTKSKESKNRKEKDERKGIDSYDPGKSTRELNPYWKDGGSGLPTAFAKPKFGSDDEGEDSNPKRVQKQSYRSHYENKDRDRQPSWRKKPEAHAQRSPPRRPTDGNDSRRQRSESTSSSSSAHSSHSEQPQEKPQAEEPQGSREDFLTDQQMNAIAAKMLKAEIMGNEELQNELKEKLERARQFRSEHKKDTLSKSFDRRGGQQEKKSNRNKDGEDVLLTRTNSKGMSRPVTHNESELWGGRAGRKMKKQKVETHLDGERVRYFADDDKYDIKQMFQAEKFTSAAESDMQFANIASKHKNPNDDLEDIFADKVRQNVDDRELDRKERDQAIREHQHMEKALDACDRCFESSKFEKQLIVSMGKHVYVSLPWHEGLQTGHCLISPLAHVSCSTQLDDDVWQEVREYMRAIDRMFSDGKKDVIFFETARHLHRRPHMTIHCVASKEFEMAPFYFKKAIQESEAEWATNKQLISLKDRDIRRGVPKGLAYFWVNFGMHSGFAHVIEDADRYPHNFAQETIGGLLNLDARLWRRPRRVQNPIPKVKQFADWFKSYDPAR